IRLAYVRRSSNPAALADFRRRRIQMFKAAENLIVIVLDPGGVDLFRGPYVYAALIECPLGLFCAPKSDRRRLYNATSLQAAVRRQTPLRPDHAIDFIENCGALDEVRTVIEYQHGNTHKRVVPSHHIRCLEDKKLL